MRSDFERLFFLSILALAATYLHAADSVLLPVENDYYTYIEGIFLESGVVPPFEDIPIQSEYLAKELKKIGISEDEYRRALSIREVPDPLSLLLETSLRAQYNNETDRLHFIQTADRKIVDYLSLYDAHSTPSAIGTGFMAAKHNFFLLCYIDLRATPSSLLEDHDILNIPDSFVGLDMNVPYQGGISFYADPFEFRFFRDKLQLGPGRWSSLSLNTHMPYFDYISAKLDFDHVSLSAYLVRLDPILSPRESTALMEMTAGENPDLHARTGLPYTDRSKHLAVHKLVLRPFPWLTLGLTELNLIGGRDPQLEDFNPLIVFHNSYNESTNIVSSTFTATLVPIRGVMLYGEFYLYDAVVGDELNPRFKPTALAYQAGLSVLSSPFFSLGPGRLRLDGELSIVDPWVYHRWYNLRKYTSRIAYIDSYGLGRYWVDYPLGYYLGPDSFDLHVALTYERPLRWAVSLLYNKQGLGSIDLYGWGDDSLFSRTEEEDMPLTGAPTSRPGIPASWIDRIRIDGFVYLTQILKLSAWFEYKYVQNRYHVEGDDRSFLNLGLDAKLTLF